MTRSFSSLLCKGALLLSASAPAFALWPLPSGLELGSTTVKLDSNFSIQVSGISTTPDDLQAAIDRTTNYIATDGLERLVVGRGSVDADSLSNASTLFSLVLQYTGTADAKSITEESQVLVEDRVETYSLTVPADGSSATISANSTLGLFRGLTTFEQLWYTYGDAIYTVSAPVTIQDSPAYVSIFVVIAVLRLLMWMCGTLMMHVMDSLTAVSCSTLRVTSELLRFRCD